jgi:hypothetical protein
LADQYRLEGGVVNLESSVETYLQEIIIPLRLSAVTAAGWPVVLSLWYLYEEGALYCATPRRAKVVEYLLREPRCGFEVAADLPPYCGVRGRAVAHIEEDRGLEILESLLIRYLGSAETPLARNLLARPEPEVAIRLEPRSSHRWDFTDRMADSTAQPLAKICPG